MAFITVPPAVIDVHAAAEAVTPQRAAQIIAAIPAGTARALAQFGAAAIHTLTEWVAAFPSLGTLPANEQQFVLRVTMDGIGGVVIDDGVVGGMATIAEAGAPVPAGGAATG